MDSPLKAMQRYLYIGSDVPFFFESRHTPLDVELAKQIISPAVHSPAQAADVLKLIKFAINGKDLRRTNECLFALAFCAREFPTDEEKHAVYLFVPELVTSSQDLFQFLAYYVQLSTQSGHAGFGHGIRRAITNWYEKHTPLQLAEMLAKSCSAAGWTHKDVIAKTHLKLACPEKQALIDAVMKRTTQLRACKRREKKRSGDKQGSNEEAAAVVVVTEQSSEALKRYKLMRQFKSASTVTKVVDFIKNHGMTIDLMPLHFKRSVKVWEALYPTITYRDLLHAALPMQDFHLLKADEPNGKTYAATLEKRLGALEEEQIHPIEVQETAVLFETRRRYSGKIKEMIHKLNVPLDDPVHEGVLKKLQEAMEHSFSHHPKTGARYYIALDLRKPHQKKKVFRNEVISCFHASVLLAFSIFKRERNVTVVAFTDQEGTLKPVQFTSSMKWEQAVAHCEEFIVEKTQVSLAAPIERAEAEKLKIDVFITITDSLIRVNPTRVPPYCALQKYRKKFKLNLSRYVAISLSRHEPSFDFSACEESSGMLEMVGYNASTPKVIAAFAKNLFN